MSAFISIVAPDGAFLLTDAATYDNDGIVRKIASKVFTAKSVPVAITTRGHAEAGEFIARTLCDLADDIGAAGLIDNLQSVIDEICGSAEAVLSGINALQVLVVAFIPERGGLHRSFASQTSNATLSAAPFNVVTPESVFAGGPFVTTEMIFASGVPYKAAAEAMGDYVLRIGADIMEVMRRTPGPRVGHSEDDAFYGVGGRCELTAVTAFGASTEVLRVWDDKIGRKINPAAAAETVCRIGPNRAARRKFARMA